MLFSTRLCARSQSSIHPILARSWPSSSPDLNPIDYDLRSILKRKGCSKHLYSLESLKQSIRLAVKNFPIERMRAAIDNWPKRFKYGIGDNHHFEYAFVPF